MLPVSNLLVAIMIPRVLPRSDLQCDCSSRRTSLSPDRTASGLRAGCASRGSAGRGRLEGHGPCITETASSETDCTRDSARARPYVGIARLSEAAQSGEREAVSCVPRGWRQRVSVGASPRRPRPAGPREKARSATAHVATRVAGERIRDRLRTWHPR